MTLAELGDLLRDERVKHGFSVDEVASRLKITSRVVRGIEEGDAESLPHAVYARGFIRAYASLVGISADEVRPALQLLADPEEESLSAREISPPPASGRHSGWMLPVVVIMCCVAFAAYWVYRNQWPSVSQLLSETTNRAMPMLQDTTQSTPVPKANAEPGTSTSQVGAASLSTSLPGTLKTPAEASPLPISPPASAPNLSVLTSETVPPTPGITRAENDPVHTNGFTTPQGATQTSAADSSSLTLHNGSTQTDVTNAGQGKHQIILTSLQECWVHSTADSTDTRQFSLKKGDVFALSFDRNLVIKLGNAGGVRIKYDGKELPPPGAMGQVRTLNFPPVEPR